MINGKNDQFEIEYWAQADVSEVKDRLINLISMHKRGLLGGAVMPEDDNPQINKESIDNYHFFTLPMALNYQRNSYKLWTSARKTYEDENTKLVFNPCSVVKLDIEELRGMLLKYKVALQPNKHVEVWRKICQTICSEYNGTITQLFIKNNYDLKNILNEVQIVHKKGFPYLSGPKICNYWLYVMGNYTNAKFSNKNALSIAPDTHVIQSSIHIGLINPKYKDSPQIQNLVNEAWTNVLEGSDISLIDIHTPLWLWSRGGFARIM
jgi:hypothetical protein